MDFREFLVSPHAYLPPAHAIEGLSADDAERRPSAGTHSIAEIIAHLTFWQDWFLARCSGRHEPMIAAAADGWPAVEKGSWPQWQSRFIAGTEALAALGDGDASRPLAPPIEFPPLARYTIADALVHVATHNAHHLGQVVVIRQVQGTWPPPAGSWTW